MELWTLFAATTVLFWCLFLNKHQSNSHGPLLLNGLILISACISNYIRYKLWDEITNPFLNFNGRTVEV